MFHPLSIFVGLRYVRARSHKFFVSFITWVSLAGVCVGVAALIVILSVMNGFESELRDSLLALSAHARVVARDASSAPPSVAQWQSTEGVIRGVSGVVGVAPYIEIQALAMRQTERFPVVLRGIEPAAEGSVTQVASTLTHGSLADLRPGSDNVIVGSIVAERLGLAPGDRLQLLILTVGADGAPEPKLRELTVAGTFEADSAESDSTLVLMGIEDVRALESAGRSGEGLRVRFRDVMAAPALADVLRKLMPSSLTVIDWTQDHASYFRAIRIEKTMMSLILLLIVAVAAFNLVAMLVMVVTDKRTDIAILRTFGTSPRRVLGIFLTQGLVIGWLGVVLGVALGLAVALNVSTIVPVLQSTFGFEIFDPTVYYNTAIPSEVHAANVAIIALAAFLMTALATVYPAVRAARTAPAEALRYE